MESAGQLLLELEKRDIRLSVDDGKLLCNAPKGAMTLVLRDSIKQYKPDLLRLLTSRTTPATSPTTLSDIRSTGVLPLSFSQERIWLLSKLDPDNHFTGNIHFIFQLSGSLDITALEQALVALIQRHDIFRVRCATNGAQAIQTLALDTAFKLSVRDLRGLSTQEQKTAIHEATNRCALESFALETTPLLRAELLHTAEQEYLLLLATHLYLFDGWSTAVLFKDLSALYAALHAGNPSPLPKLETQYADFAHWYHQWLEGAEAQRQTAWWLDKLQNTQLVTQLPFDYPRASQTVSQSASVEFTLPTFLTEAMRNLTQQAGVTLFSGLLAAFQTLLYAYTRQEKMSIGTIVSNRRLSATENMIGSFANNILIPADLALGTTFRDLLKQIAQTTREAYANQDLPFERLLGKLNPNLTRHPLFRVMFVLHQHQSQAGSGTGLELTGVQVRKLPDAVVLSRYDLELVMVDRHAELSGLFVYNAALFKPSTIEQLKNNFLLVLRQITDNPQLALMNLPHFNSQTTLYNHPTNQQVTVEGYVAPRTPTEQAITRLWEDLLGLNQISVHDSFIDQGGHSLLAITLLAKLKAELEVDIPLCSLQEFPNIATLAEWVDQQKLAKS